MEEDESPEGPLAVEWVRQNNVIYVALMGLGLIMVQPFLTATSLDTSAKICVIAFAAAIPLLAALAMLNEQEEFRRRMADSRLASLAKATALTGAFVGIVAGFWHIYWVAGVTMIGAAVVGTMVHSAGYVRLERGLERSR